MAYAWATLQAWGSKPFFNKLREVGKDLYHNNSGENDNRDGELDDTTLCISPDPACVQAQRPNARNLKKALPTHQEETVPEFLMDDAMGLWMRPGRQDKGKEERMAALELARSRQRVKAWIDSKPGLNFNSSTVPGTPEQYYNS